MRIAIFIFSLLLIPVFVSAQSTDRAGHFLKQASSYGRTAVILNITGTTLMAVSPMLIFPKDDLALNKTPGYIVGSIGLGLNILGVIYHYRAWKMIDTAGDRLRVVSASSGTIGLVYRL